MTNASESKIRYIEAVHSWMLDENWMAVQSAMECEIALRNLGLTHSEILIQNCRDWLDERKQRRMEVQHA